MVVHDIDGVAHVKLQGRFDISCVPHFQRLITPERAAWVVDLSDVDYVDSSALGILLLLREKSGNGRQVRLLGARGQIRDVLLMVKFDRMFAMD